MFNGLMAVSEDYVLIHDGARPFLEQECLDRICQCLSEHDACLLTVPCKDTIKVIEDGKIKEHRTADSWCRRRRRRPLRRR